MPITTVIDKSSYSAVLEKVASELDISPSNYQMAVDRYQAVGRWLERGEYPGCSNELSIYPQGSFRLGTVTRPIRNGIEACYDIDLVCEMPLDRNGTSPGSIKAMIGDRLTDHETYKRLLDPEGRRCWTLEYAEQDGVAFHMDVLPAIPDQRWLSETALAITHKDQDAYSWSPSNPRGFADWFHERNIVAFQRAEIPQKHRLLQEEPGVFASIDAVPDLLVRTPLQRSVQLMKRHRDIYFNRPSLNGYAPISIIITTLAGHLYSNEPDVYSALSGIVRQLQGHAALLEGKSLDHSLAWKRLIERRPDGKWRIANPSYPEENFADRWDEDNDARARAFFAWVDALQKDLIDIAGMPVNDSLREGLGRALGTKTLSTGLGVLVPTPVVATSPPRIQIADAARPWRKW